MQVERERESSRKKRNGRYELCVEIVNIPKGALYVLRAAYCSSRSSSNNKDTKRNGRKEIEGNKSSFVREKYGIYEPVINLKRQNGKI